MSAADNASTTFHAAWGPDSVASRIREDLGMCLTGAAYFETQYARNLYAASRFSGAYKSWLKERDSLRNKFLAGKG